LIAAEVADLWEDWMRHADQVLVDEGLLATIYEALGQRCPRAAAAAGRASPPRWYAPADSQACPQLELRVLEREARANLVYRSLPAWAQGRCRMPNHGALGRCSRAASHQAGSRKNGENRARKGVTDGRRMRVDTPWWKPMSIIQPTQVCWRWCTVLTRTMKKITKIAGEVGAKLRDRSRSVSCACWTCAGGALKGKQSQEKLKRAMASC